MIFDDSLERHLKSSSEDNRPPHLPISRSEELGKCLLGKLCSN